ncbi:FCH and double SH3 domains nervous wreck isoform X2 [Rhodnius prolixus]
MQPPPRKGNYVKFLKNLHTEQIAKLQLKNQNECELLDDIRNFILKRSAVEKSYAEALLKISSAFLNRKIANIPDIKTEGSEEKWNMWNVWRTVLEENEKLARARLAAVEVFSQQVADDAKILRANKLLAAKKYLDHLAMVQKELQASVQDVDKTKKFYFDEEHSAHDVRDKARDIEEKLKKKKGSFFQSITSLQKNSARVSSKRDALEEKSSGARNDYLLSLAAANAHQTRYFVVDFQNTIQIMEANVYERVADYLMLISRTELLTCTATQTSFNRIKEQSAQLSRDYNLQCVYLYYPVLKQHIQYEFEPCDNDTVSKVSAEHSSSAAALSKEAKRWANRVARENTNVKDAMAKLTTLHAFRESGQKTDPNDPNGPDIDTKMDELRHIIRRAETAKGKAEARIECLKAGGVSVDEFLQEAENLSVQDLPRSGSSMSVRTDASGTAEATGSDSMYDSDYNDAGSESAVERPTSASLDEKDRPDSAEVDGEWAILEQERQRIEQLTAGWDDPTQVDWGPEEGDSQQEEVTVPADSQGPTYKCTALYSYTAQNPDELSIVENEQLEVVGEGDGDGWLKARNYRGEEGYVPHNYLDVEREDWGPEEDEAADGGTADLGASTNLTDGPSSYQLTSQISFSSVDYTVDEEPSEQSVGQDTVREAFKPANLDLSSSSEYTSRTGDTYCIALYDYDATCPEELSFCEGEVIKVLRKVVHDDVDDGWWEGQRGDEVGLFPSLVVEECRENGEPLTPEGEDTPPGSAPPVFTPPDVPGFLLAPQAVIITQPTPLVEHKPIVDALPDSDEIPNGHTKELDTQFCSGNVEISVSEIEDEDSQPVEASMDTTDDVKSEGLELNLSVAEIVITAATPMTEEAEKPFPPPPSAETEEDDAIVDEDVPHCNSTACAESGTATVTEVAATQEENTATRHSSSTASDEETYTGPSTADNSQSVPPPSQQTDTKKHEVIPDELEPHQLARLQDLKESDA